MQAEVPFWGVLTLYLYFKQVKDCVWVCMGVHFPSFLPHYQTPELYPDFESKGETRQSQSDPRSAYC